MTTPSRTTDVTVWTRGPNPTQYDPTGELGSRTIEGKAQVIEHADESLWIYFHHDFSEMTHLDMHGKDKE